MSWSCALSAFRDARVLKPHYFLLVLVRIDVTGHKIKVYELIHMVYDLDIN